MRNRRLYLLAVLLLCFFPLLTACGGIKLKIGTGTEDPLKEYTIEGKGSEKVLVIPIKGFLSDTSETSILSSKPGTVQEVVSQLRLAGKDSGIKALVLEINSPGGSTTSSDMLYHEIMAFKERRQVPIVAVFMDVAASGGYYVALPADRIIAHPTTVTGSVGVVLIQPRVAGLMDKIGVAVDVTKSGREKDIGSPFRPATPEEQKIFQDLIDGLAGRFYGLVEKHRTVSANALASIKNARIYLPEDALKLGLIDRLGYLSDALDEARSLAKLRGDAKVIVYRRARYPNDNLYNMSTSLEGSSPVSLIDLRLRELVPTLSPGFYYLWMGPSDR